MNRLPLLIILLLSSFLYSCSKDYDPVIPANTLFSDRGLLIQLEWNTSGSSSQAIYDSDLDLYLDLGYEGVDASESLYYFEEVNLRDIYRDGTYDVYVGAVDINRHTDYTLYISAPGSHVVHQYSGYFEPGESGEVLYLSIHKQGRQYSLIDR